MHQLRILTERLRPLPFLLIMTSLGKIQLFILVLTIYTTCANEHVEFLGCHPAQEKCKFIQCGFNALWTAYIPHQKTYTNFACCADRIYDMTKNTCQGGHIVKVNTY